MTRNFDTLSQMTNLETGKAILSLKGPWLVLCRA
jgi:hypothetical protein